MTKELLNKQRLLNALTVDRILKEQHFEANYQKVWRSMLKDQVNNSIGNPTPDKKNDGLFEPVKPTGDPFSKRLKMFHCYVDDSIQRFAANVK